MRCDLLPSWNVDSSGKCRRILCDVRLEEGCAIAKHRQFLKSKLIGLAEQEANIVRMIVNERAKD